VSPREGYASGSVSGDWTLLDSASMSDEIAARRRRTGDWTLVDGFIALLL
jgi:hypothetical protein